MSPFRASHWAWFNNFLFIIVLFNFCIIYYIALINTYYVWMAR